MENCWPRVRPAGVSAEVRGDGCKGQMHPARLAHLARLAGDGAGLCGRAARVHRASPGIVPSEPRNRAERPGPQPGARDPWDSYSRTFCAPRTCCRFGSGGATWRPVGPCGCPARLRRPTAFAVSAQGPESRTTSWVETPRSPTSSDARRVLGGSWV